jgi:hypothetical protein
MSDRGPKVTLTCHRPFSDKQYRNRQTSWCDVWLSYADQTYHDPNRRRVHKAPCLNTRAALENELAMNVEFAEQEQAHIDAGATRIRETDPTHAEMVAYYHEEIASTQALLDRLDADGGIAVEEHDEPGIPDIYFNWPLDRKGAERALRAYLVTLGVHNPRFVWEKLTTYVIPLN